MQGISIPLCHGRKTSSATGRYWIGFTTNATSTSKMSPNAGTKLNGCWMMKRLLPKWQRPSYIPHTSLTFKGRHQPAVADLTGMAGSHRKSPSRTSALGQGEGTGKQLLSAGERRRRILYVKDLCSEDEGKFKITKKSLNLSAIHVAERQGKHPYLRTDLFWQRMVAVRHASRKQSTTRKWRNMWTT